ncbi:hypothetical protein chiPu_0001053 [Chiloscyllium punctatum]|uniref:Transmembrane protein 14C n=2 Tax=Chiloscyllium punctatum TaxID=137246 RepID=A0A401RWY9_CHIPU|nr:hypothetical protein [Chiloscyllium punctatum]
MLAFARFSCCICPLVADESGWSGLGSNSAARQGAVNPNKESRMPIDWISYSYATIVTVGGILGYVQKGSVMSLMSGLLFGSLAGYGAYQVSNDPQNVKISLLTAGILTTIMGVRYKRSGKIIPAGLIAGISLFMVLRLVFVIL